MHPDTHTYMFAKCTQLFHRSNLSVMEIEAALKVFSKNHGFTSLKDKQEAAVLSRCLLATVNPYAIRVFLVCLKSCSYITSTS